MRTLTVLLLCFISRLGFAAPFEEIIAFGDSLTDVGNSAGITKVGYSPLINGYFEESHYSDNVLWVEILASYWDLPARTAGRGDSTSLPPEPYGNTWAWGGSEATSGSVQPGGATEPIPNLLTEIDHYLAANSPNDSTLYAILSGADNLLVGQKFGPFEAKKAVDAIISAMRSLSQAGAKNFVIFNMPKLGDTPAAQQNIFMKLAADIYTDSFNFELKLALDILRKDRSFSAKIYFVDLYKELVQAVDLVKHGGTYQPGFFVPGADVAISNVTDLGLNYFNANGTYPENYLFWDIVHPTTQGHQLLAGLVLKAINSQSRQLKKKHVKN